jgi:hypothetical protein
MYSTLPSIGSTMIYSSAYSIAIDWILQIMGMTDVRGIANLGGASSLMYLRDGVTSSSNVHSTWVCISDAPMVLLQWTR